MLILFDCCGAAETFTPRAQYLKMTVFHGTHPSPLLPLVICIYSMEPASIHIKKYE